MSISRRCVLAAGAALPFMGAARAAENVGVAVDASRVLRRLPADFMGLGFESLAVATPGLLSQRNGAYVRLVRNLGTGVIRIGGNVSDYTRYDANGVPATGPKATVITQGALREFRGFLDAVGWNAIWGLNLGTGTVQNAVTMARDVAAILGERLICFQIGNEPDLFVTAGHRSGTYGYGRWLNEYRRFKIAIRAALPRARFAGPDISDAGVSWVENFARDEGHDAAMLTAHHYIAGRDNPASTHALLLREETRFQQNNLAKFQAAARRAEIPWRMSETATLYGGGKPGVSDSFASALWVLDYLFVLANHGAAGANLQTGINHLGRLSAYSPITDDGKGRYGAAPEYYGLLAFAQMAQGEMVAVSKSATTLNLSVHAVKGAGGLTVALINKDMKEDAAVTLTGVSGTGRVLRLSAPSVSALNGVTLGGGGVGSDGVWSGKSEAHRGGAITVPAASAALVTYAI